MADRSFAGPGNPRYPAAAWHARVTAQRAKARQGVAHLAEVTTRGEGALAAQAEVMARRQTTWLQATQAYKSRQAIATRAWQLALAAVTRAHAAEAMAQAEAGRRLASAESATHREHLIAAGQRLARANGAVDAVAANREQWQQARLRAASRKQQDG
ncbi:MAG: hypothetical protein IPL79_19465 [Myxococcales bacterium]|nr:hypothetical protein [Myxococcales bacterium]